MERTNDILDFLLQRKAECVFVFQAHIDTICKYACALANHTGGSIIVGMDDNSNVVGVDPTVCSVLSHRLKTYVSPNLPYTIYTTERDNKVVIIVSVLEGANKPYSILGRFYIMVADSYKEVDVVQMNQLFDAKCLQDQNWEREPMGDATMEDLDVKVLNRFKDNLVKNNKVSLDSSPKQVLRSMGFLSDGQLTHAALVVAGNQPSVFFPQTRIRVSVFGDNNELTDVRLFDCSLVDAIDRMVEYVYSLYPEKLIIKDLERRNGETMPKVALREGILNACVHRVYDDYRSFIRVNVYPDSLEIINSGLLLKGVRIQDFGKKHNSMLRNPDIAHAFFVLGYIEAAGSGTVRIVDECKKNECRLPIWEEIDGCVKLTFNVSRPVLKNNTTRETLVENLSSDVSVRASLLKILGYLEVHDKVKNQELSVLIEKSYATTKRYLQVLKDAGLIMYSGSLKTGGWQLMYRK